MIARGVRDLDWQSEVARIFRGDDCRVALGLVNQWFLQGGSELLEVTSRSIPY